MELDVVPEENAIITSTPISGSPLITAPSQRLATQAGRKGFDMAREIVDNLRKCRKKGQSPDLILVSRQTDHYLKTAWLEIGMPSNTIPKDIDGVELRMSPDLTVDYAFLRDYIPWEKRKGKKNGQMLYGPQKKLVGVRN